MLVYLIIYFRWIYIIVSSRCFHWRSDTLAFCFCKRIAMMDHSRRPINQMFDRSISRITSGSSRSPKETSPAASQSVSASHSLHSDERRRPSSWLRVLSKIAEQVGSASLQARRGDWSLEPGIYSPFTPGMKFRIDILSRTYTSIYKTFFGFQRNLLCR